MMVFVFGWIVDDNVFDRVDMDVRGSFSTLEMVQVVRKGVVVVACQNGRFRNITHPLFRNQCGYFGPRGVEMSVKGAEGAVAGTCKCRVEPDGRQEPGQLVTAVAS
jgi:hypothetical protein